MRHGGIEKQEAVTPGPAGVYRLAGEDKFLQLEFIEMWQEGKCMYGMIDSGAALNCIGSERMRGLKTTAWKEKRVIIEGLGGTTKTQGVAVVPLELANGAKIAVEFTVVESLGGLILLGLPFLRQVEARIDFANGFRHNVW